ncbi:DUF2294 domain-containing protein [Sporolituus thermophilus]|uniref:Uncharacterized protein YbcI n=1 Tax=Sporolituus thermophilus DSM 23256 TaxID=1123285 RepID=A0A1G7JZZ7_9FIRM|nr:DUF2294 domain-containing protein [Sporolituus thermophilus]SDF30321.1 Uncharacterized protein YbcI [Sporolituus thermophilus DSM 23256]
MAIKKTLLEAEINDAFIKFQRSLIGRGPTEAKTYIIDDMVLIRLKGVLTIEETHLVKTEKGRQVVKQMRQILRETFNEEAENLVARLTGCRVVSSHSDISTKTGERVEIYILDTNLEKRLRDEEKAKVDA